MTDTAMIARANAARLAGRADRAAERALAEADLCLIVYGSLAPGAENGHILAPLGGVWTEVTIRGRLIELGWGAARGYPGLALDRDNEEIAGHAITSVGLRECWDALDHFEGEEYVRLLHPYLTLDGRRGIGNVYVLASHARVPA